LNKETLLGIGNKIKALGYGPFEILEKVGDNSYQLSLPPYMHIYSVVNVGNLKLIWYFHARLGSKIGPTLCGGFCNRRLGKVDRRGLE